MTPLNEAHGEPLGAPHPGTPAPASTQAARTLAFLLLLLFLNLQADGFPLGTPTTIAFQLRLLPFTAVFLALFGLCLYPSPLARRLPPRLASTLLGWRAPLAVATLFLALALPLLLSESRHYARFGYHLFPALAAAVFLPALAALALQLRRPTALALTLAAIVTAVTLLSIHSFPLSAQRSDMLPLLAAASRTLLHHADPYRLYTLASGTLPLTYLPGTLLAFTPATLLHLDLRLTNLLALLLLLAVVLLHTRPAHRLRAAALLAAFLLGPYLLYRHEIYTPPHWLLLAAALLTLHSGRLLLASLFFGVSIAMSQFSWVLFPFFLLHILQASTLRKTCSAAALALAAAAVFVLPFLVASPHTFLAGIFGRWSGLGVNARPVNLSFFTALVVGASHLQLAQAAVLVLLFAAAVRRRSCRTVPGLLHLCALALCAFVLLNPLVWGYFFLLIELLLLLFVLSAEDAFTPAASHP